MPFYYLTVLLNLVYSQITSWSDGRVVERGGLENRYTFSGIGGSNPSRSVDPKRRAL